MNFKNFVIFQIICAFFILTSGFLMPKVNAQNLKSTEITAYNSYKIDVFLEVQCNWNNNIKNYDFHKYYIVKGKSNTTIKVPSYVSNCKIWSKIKWW